MARPRIKTIRASSHPLGTGDFTTIQAWEDYADDKVNPYQWAECFSGFNLGTFTLSGWSSTPTPSGYPRIFASSGELHNGNITTGPIIYPGEDSTEVNTIAVSHAKVDGLGSTRGFHMDIDTASNMTVENCWATSKNDFCFKAKSSVGTTSSSGNIFKNCLAIGTTHQDIGFELGGSDMAGGKPGIQCHNCTAYGHKNSCYRVHNTALPGFYGGADVQIFNCIGADSDGSDFSFSSGGNGFIDFRNNISTDFSVLDTSDVLAVQFDQASSSLFKNPTKTISINSSGGLISVSSTADFRLRKNSRAINGGVTIDSVLSDIRLMPRPFASGPGTEEYDVGAYEFGGFPQGVPLFITGPNLLDNKINLTMFSPPKASGVNPLFIEGGVFVDSSGIPLHTRGLIKSQSENNLFVEGTKFKELVSLSIKPHATINNFGLFFINDEFASRLYPMFISGRGPQKEIDLSIPNIKDSSSSFSTLFVNAPIPKSNTAPLNIGNFTLKRRGLLYIEGKDPRVILGDELIVFASGVKEHFTLHLKGLINTGDISASTRLPDSRGRARTEDSFFLDTDLENTNKIGLNTQGFSGITAPDSVSFFRNELVDSSDFKPSKSEALLFAGSERNCADGSLYKFDNNTNDNSQDYGFKLYASGWRSKVGGSFTGPYTPESGFFQTSDRFPASSLTGSGVSRFKGDLSTPYYGTVLVQSGSPSINDQHRITPKDGHLDSAGNFTPARRGVSTSFWIKRKGPAPGYVPPVGSLGIRGVLGNCEIGFKSRGAPATSGQWSIYYAGHNSNVKASGDTPFNSLKDFLKPNSENKLQGELSAFGGLIPFVNTTAGGRMGRIGKTNDDGELTPEHLPGLMIPFDDDRWYFINYWVDTELYQSFVRVASPAKGHPGQSGYMPEIKPITDVSQKWDGYEVKTDTDDIKFKVGGLLQRGSDSVPYSNLGLNISLEPKQQEEFLIDELVVSNKVCSVNAMEQQFDLDYRNFTKQFLAQGDLNLFVSGFEQDVSIPQSGEGV